MWGRDEWARKMWERVLMGVRTGLRPVERRSMESAWEV